ncbi:MAG: glycosyltransferase family 2 protein [Angustibacter sp.]
MDRWHAALAEQLRGSGRGGAGAAVLVQVPELESLQHNLGRGATDQLRAVLLRWIRGYVPAATICGWWSPTTVAVLVPRRPAVALVDRLSQMSHLMAGNAVQAAGEWVHLTAAVGLTDLDSQAGVGEVLERAEAALADARNHLDLVPRVVTGPVTRSAHRAPKPRRGTGALIAATYALGLLPPLCCYQLAWLFGVDLTGPAYVVIAVASMLTTGLIWGESLRSLIPVAPPLSASAARAALDEAAEGRRRPSAALTGGSPVSTTAVIAAYLPNEAATIEETLEAFLAHDPPGGLQVLLAYNTPKHLPVQDRLADLARRDPRLELVRVPHSTSKAQNINAALPLIRGDIVGVFDADHHPAPGSFERARRWLDGGYDVVQGHCVVRNGSSSRLASVVAAEFEVIYGISHPGRARWHGFGIFGGSNGYWRTEALRAVRFRRDMLTEDIDASMRGLLMGLRITSDPQLVSTELAPADVQSLWRQRLRWAQGWHQVALRRLGSLLRSDRLSVRQRLGAFALLGWTQVMPWLSLQVWPLIAFALLHPERPTPWLLPFLAVMTLATTSSTVAQAVLAWVMAHPRVRRRPGWFLLYAVASLIVYVEGKNLVVRTSHLQQLLGRTQWVVTPRTAQLATESGPSAERAVA